MSIKQTIPKPKEKQDFKGQSHYLNHRISFDTKGPTPPSSEEKSYRMVIVDASWHKYKTELAKADTTVFGNKLLLRYFRKFNNTTINEKTDLLENQTPDSKVPCLPLSMMLIAFNISHTQNTKEHSGSENPYSK